MPKVAVHISFLFFAITALSGVIMRLIMYDPTLFPQIPMSFFLHGHSHMGVLGWTFLAVFILYLTLTWEQLAAKKQALMIIITTCIITLLMFIAFLYQGYAMYSIILSTIHIGIEYWMVAFIVITMKQQNMPFYTTLFIKGALVSLVLSSFGPFILGGLGMAGLKDTAFFDMAIYFFLHFQYNGWLYLMLIGLFLFILHKKRIRLHQPMITASFWIYFLSLFPGYVLNILWFDFNSLMTVAAMIGAFGQFIGILLFLTAVLQNKGEIMERFSPHIRTSLLFVFLILLIKSITEFGLLYEPLATYIFDTRSIIVGYLHLTFLGFISIFSITQYQMVDLLQETKKTVLYGMAIFIGGFVLNEAILFFSGFVAWFNISIDLQGELLLFASFLLLLGVLVIWSSLFHTNAD